jgi:hypothetical protein
MRGGAVRNLGTQGPAPDCNHHRQSYLDQHSGGRLTESSALANQRKEPGGLPFSEARGLESK